MFKEYDIVKINHDIPGEKIKEGTRGVIVMIYDEPNLPVAYEVEFFGKNGETLRLVTLKEDDLYEIE